MSTFPNPATDHFTLDYLILEPFNTVTMMILDGNGKMIMEYRLNRSQDQVLLPVPDAAEGRYDCVLVVDGKIYASADLILAKR